MRSYAEHAIVIAWFTGVIAGHWFHFFSEGKAFVPQHMYTLIALTIPVILIGLYLCKLPTFPNWALYVTLQAGIHAGVFLWRV